MKDGLKNVLRLIAVMQVCPIILVITVPANEGIITLYLSGFLLSSLIVGGLALTGVLSWLFSGR